MKRKFTLLIAALALLTMIVQPGRAWGQTTVTQTSFSAISGNVNNDSNVSYAAYKGEGTSNPAVNSNAIRLYQNSGGKTGGYVVIGVADGYQITSATIQSTMATTTGYLLTDTDPGSTTPAKSTFDVSDYSLSANTDYTVDELSTRYITFACFGTSSSSRLYLSKISITYESTSGGNTPSLSVNPAAVNFGSKAMNPAEPYSETFTVTYGYLTENLTVSVGEGLTGVSVDPQEISKDGDGSQTVTVYYNPTTVSEISGNITVSNTEDELSKTVAVSGSSYDPTSVVIYERYTGAIVEGDYIIYNTNGAMKNVISSNRFANESVTVTNNTITNPEASVVWHIAADGDYWTIYNAAVNKYAGGTTSKNQGALLDEVNDHARWIITYQYSNFTIENYGRSQDNSDPANRYLRQNTTASAGWATYGSGTGYVPTLYKKAGATTYSVTYNANGATSGSVPTDDNEYESGNEVTVLGNTGDLAKAGYVWAGWNTKADGTGTDHAEGSKFNISENTTLYAKWDAKTITNLTSSGTPTATQYDGQAFNPAGLTVTATFNDESQEDVTSQVVWTPNPLTIETTSVTGTYMGLSVVVEGITVTYAPGTQDNPYTVAQARAATPATGTSANVYIHGIVSAFYNTSIVGDGSNYRYYISDDGSTTNQLLVYKGKGLNNETFSNANDLLIGDIVTINGGLTMYQSEPEIASGNYLTSLERPAVDVEAPTYSIPEGGYAEAQTVTITCATDGATIYYTLDGSAPDNNSTQYLEAIAVSETTTIKAIAYVGESLSTVSSATYYIKSAGNTHTVTEALAFESYPVNNTFVQGIVSTAPTSLLDGGLLTYCISVDGTTTSQLQVYKGKGLNNAAFEAISDIQVGDIVAIFGNVKIYNAQKELDQGNYLVEFERKVATPTFNPAAGEYPSTQNVTIACATEGATIYYTTDGTDPTTGSTEYTAAIEVSETKTIKAIGVKDGMNNSAIATATYTIVLTPSVTVTPNVINAPAAGAVGSLALTYENITDFVGFDYYFCDVNGVELEDKPNWIYAEIQEENETYSLDYLIDDNDGEARTAYIKVYTYDDDMEEVYAIVTFNQAEFVIDYATLPFSFNYGRDSIAETTGLTQSGLGSDYSDNNTKLKFDGTGDWVILKINERPGTLTFDIKGNGFSGGTFKVQTSADGTNYTDLETYDGLTSTVQSEEFTTLGENVRYIKWIYTEKVSGNVGLGNITLVQYVEPVATPTFNPEEGTYTEAQSVTITCATEGATIYYTTDGSDPTTESTEYTDAIEVATTTTIKAIGVKEGLANSAIAAATYTINIPSIVLSSYLIEATAAEKEGNLAITLENIEITEDGGGEFDMIFCDEDGNPLSDKPEWFEFDFPYENDTCSVYYLIAENTTESSREAYFKIYGLGDDGETEATSNLVTVTQAAAAQTFTVNFTLDGGTFVPYGVFTDTIVEIEAGTYNLPSATKDGFEFAGWNDGNATYEADAEYTVEADVDFTAQWTEVVGVTYELVTSTDDIVPDCYYLITSGTDGTVKAMAGQSTNNRTAVAVTASNSVISNIGDAVEFIISGDGTDLNPYTIYDENVPGYLYAAGTGSSNYLKTQGVINERAQWTITIDNDNKAIITALTTETDRKVIRYNSTSGSNGIFSCYGSGQQPIYLFKKVDNTPTISFNGPSANIGTYPTGEEITWDNIIVSQHNLTENISLSVKKGTVTPTSIVADAEPTEVVWSYTPTTAGYTVDTITATSGTVEATFLIQFVAKTPHNINIASVENGTIAVVGGKTTEIEGENVDFTVTPDEGYVIDEITVMAEETPVDYIQGETFYRFQMPDSDVTISATFTALPTYTVSFSVNGTVDSDLTETVTTGSSIDLPTESALTPDGFTIYGWAEANSTEAVAEPYEPTGDVTLHALLQLENAPATSENYVKVTEELTDWSGEYLIVYEDGNVAFNGNLETFDAVGNTVNVVISSSTIVANDDMNNAAFTIAPTDGGYSIQGTRGKYIGVGSYANGLTTNDDPVANAISIDESGNALITITFTGGDMTLKYNDANNQLRFRYYKSGQKDIQLYKKTSGAAIPTIINVEHVSGTTSMSTNIPDSTCYVVEDGAVLTFTGTNEGTAANIVVQEGGQLIHEADVEATVQKGVSAYTSKSGNGWYLISSPVDGISTSAVATGTYDLFAYDEETAYWWVDHAIPGQPANHTFTTLERGKGYLYANAADVNLNYAGTTKATNANITVDLSYACEYPDFKGFNLVGNPFTRNITATDMVIGENEVTSYYDFNADRTEFMTYQTNERPIQPGQGFFIQATANAQQLEFNPTTSKDASDFKYISISAGDESFTDKAYIQLGYGNTLRKMTFGENTMVYVMNNDEDYAAARVEELAGMMPVHFVPVEDGTYTITVETKNIENINYMRLIDNIDNVDIDLLVEPTYTFKACTPDDANRFTLLFDFNIYTGVNENYTNANFAYQIGDEIFVSGEGTLQVFDMLGRFVADYDVNGDKRISTSAFNNGVYIFRMVGTEMKTQKIVVR